MKKLSIGDEVIWEGDLLDERDRPFPRSAKRRLTVFSIAEPGWSYDYGIESQQTFNHFYVSASEITLPDGTPVEQVRSEMRLPHMLPTSPLNPGGWGTTSEKVDYWSNFPG